MAKVLILYVDAGHGHRKVAEAVGAELKSRNIPGLQIEIADALERTNRLFHRSYPQVYFRLVLWVPWLWGFFYYILNLPLVYFFVAPLRSAWNWLQSQNLRGYLKAGQFDVILFTHFFPAEVSATVKRKGLVHSKLITIVTDVIPHCVWQNPGTDYYWVMAEESADVLVQRGVPRSQILPMGIPVSLEFLKQNDVSVLRNKFGLKPGRLTILFTSGSFGIGPTEAVLDSFKEIGEQIQVLVVCGKNKTLFETLNQKLFPFPVIILGFVENMPELMSVADLLIAKPGGATTCESLVKKLPMVITSPIPGQESYNAKWLLGHHAAFEINHTSEIKDVVVKIINQPNLLEAARNVIEQIAKPRAAADIADFILTQLRSMERK